MTKDGGVLAPAVGRLPKQVCNQNFETAFVIDLAAARKRLRPETLERRKGPRTIEMLDRAEAFQDLLDRGAVNNRAELARLHGISRARVTQLMDLLWLPPRTRAVLRDRAACGTPIPSERRLRLALRLARGGNMAAVLALVSETPKPREETG